MVTDAKREQTANRARLLLYRLPGISGAAFGATNAELSRLIDKLSKPAQKATPILKG